VYRDKQGGIAAASNSALALATGEFVGFIDNDDVLRPHALYSMAAYLREHPDADLVYSDEDKLLPEGGLGAPTFKPDFSPDRLLAENYINHLTLVRRSLASEVGGFREGFDGSQDHDLMLRVAERATHVGHVPDVLYAWRMVPGSTAVSAGFKPLAQDAGRRAVADALERRGLEGADGRRHRCCSSRWCRCHGLCCEHRTAFNIPPPHSYLGDHRRQHSRCHQQRGAFVEW
jgi:glycosyltransferase involved in cell wall biosynthesis